MHQIGTDLYCSLKCTRNHRVFVTWFSKITQQMFTSKKSFCDEDVHYAVKLSIRLLRNDEVNRNHTPLVRDFVRKLCAKDQWVRLWISSQCCAWSVNCSLNVETCQLVSYNARESERDIDIYISVLGGVFRVQTMANRTGHLCYELVWSSGSPFTILVVCGRFLWYILERERCVSDGCRFAIGIYET